MFNFPGGILKKTEHCLDIHLENYFADIDLEHVVVNYLLNVNIYWNIDNLFKT